MPNRCLIIDHNDSFTHNVRQWLLPIFSEVVIVNYDQLSQITAQDVYQLIVISPGPGRPSDYPQSMDFIRKLENKVHIIGICLGMQMLLEMKGFIVGSMKTPLHGKVSPILQVRDSILFKNIDNLVVCHYHSLCVKMCESPLVCSTDDTGSYIMSFEDTKKLLIGVQFHPESFLTTHNDLLLENIKRWCDV